MTSHTSYKHSISKEEINALPRRSYTGAIHLIDSDLKMAAAIKTLSGEKVLGFDTESRPAFKSGESYLPSLVQFASSDEVYIFQLKHIGNFKKIADILADKNIIKAGVAIRDDIIKLTDLFEFKPKGFIELADLAAKANIKNAGLRGLAALLFGFKISKRVKISRWDMPKLTHEQIVYAATDAWICREIYLALLQRLCRKI